MSNTKKYERLIVWIRRELRVQDHLALWSAIQDAYQVVPLYIIDERFETVAPAKKKVIIDSLRSVSATIKNLGGTFVIREGNPNIILMQLLNEYDAAGVYVTKDYSPDVRRQDTLLKSEVENAGKVWREFKDAVLFEEREILTSTRNEPFTVFTPYKNAWRVRQEDIPPVLPKITKINTPKLKSGSIPLSGIVSELYPIGGEEQAEKVMREFLQQPVRQYHDGRNRLDIQGTSRLSHHLAVGNISIRTLYHAIQEQTTSIHGLARQGLDTFLNEIIWREFYYQILANFPQVTTISFKSEYENLSWSKSKENFDAWCHGETGYPVVDAAMRQLNSEGWMHNRGRMIVASFLTKDLHLDWRKGEEYFMSRLADGDLALNNGGWQWCAGTGNDAQPWFRIFNPVLQGKKFDPDGAYVKRYVPELSNVPEKFVHEPWLMPENLQKSIGCSIGKQYPDPIVNHELERRITLERYGIISRNTKMQHHNSINNQKRITEGILQ